jgi:hypothetical protein
MRAELKSLDWDGHALPDFRPEDAGRFRVTVAASIGPAGQDGAELFQFTVCSPQWLAEESLPKGFAFQRHTLLVDRWNPDLVERAIHDLCLRTEGDDWSEIAASLSRFGLWEFEDYRPLAEQDR